MSLNIRPFNPENSDDERSVISLWEKCGLTVSWNNPQKDIARKLKVQPELFLVGTFNDELIATIMAGYEGHRGWLNYLAVHPDQQNFGYGKKMVQKAESILIKMGCPKINLQIREGNAKVYGFYQNLGFTSDPVISMGKRLDIDQFETIN